MFSFSSGTFSVDSAKDFSAVLIDGSSAVGSTVGSFVVLAVVFFGRLAVDLRLVAGFGVSKFVSLPDSTGAVLTTFFLDWCWHSRRNTGT